MKVSAFIFIVESPPESAKWYQRLLGIDPTYAAPNFVQFNVRDDLEFGLWANFDAVPPRGVGGGASEICFHVDDVEVLYARALELGADILAAPQDLDFGRTFVVADPDGHRVRLIREFE